LDYKPRKRIGHKEAQKAQNIDAFAHFVPFCGCLFLFHAAVPSVSKLNETVLEKRHFDI
jgi:hypothetical protein